MTISIILLRCACDDGYLPSCKSTGEAPRCPNGEFRDAAPGLAGPVFDLCDREE